MANIASLLKRIESGVISDEEKLNVLSQVEQSLQDMRQKKQEAIQSNVMLIVDALKQMQYKVEQQLEQAKAIVPEKGLKGDKGEKGDRGLDGRPGKDGIDGKDGKDGQDGQDGVSVADAKIDFDGSLVITLSSGREINVGEVLPLDVSDKIKVIANGGGTSQTVVDTLTSLQDQINTLTGIDGVLGDMAQQNANAVAITGGAIDGATIGGTTPAAGTFTTLTATGQTSLGGVAGAEAFRAVVTAGSTARLQATGGVVSGGSGTVEFAGASNGSDVVNINYATQQIGNHAFKTGAGKLTQFNVTGVSSAVNYVQVTGAATTAGPTISAQGSDTNADLNLTSKGSGSIFLKTNGSLRNGLEVFHGGTTVNYFRVTGSATGNAIPLSAQGSDTNISQVFQPKGTGAIDLAAGSSGVNISNGGTVTAITRTATGSGYTSPPTVTVSAPTTAGGVQATATASVFGNTATVVSGGTGYTLNDVVTLVGGTPVGSGATYTVTGVSGGVVTTVSPLNFQSYTATPANPVSVTGGTGSGLTLTVTYGYQGATITNAGSGYVEQPTVTFSGGGGSGAAAYATVGSGTTVRSLGSTMSFYTPSGEQFRVRDNTTTAVNYATVKGSASGSTVDFGVDGTDAGITLALKGKGSGGVASYTAGGNNLQFLVSHTASAVNYVQVTGAATTAAPSLSVAGSDTNIAFTITPKGTGAINLSGTTRIGFNAANYLSGAGAATGLTPTLSALGSDTNIDLALTPKGTGNVRFGTYTGTALTIAGYIEIKDSGGTVRKLAVVA